MDTLFRNGALPRERLGGVAAPYCSRGDDAGKVVKYLTLTTPLARTGNGAGAQLF